MSIAILGGMPVVFGQIIEQTMDGGMDIEITYPDEIIIGRDATISILIENNGWEDKQDISFEFSSQDERLVAIPKEIVVEKLFQGGSHGSTVDVLTTDNASRGINFLNVKYSQVLVANNETPQPAIFHDFAIPIMLKESPEVTTHTRVPESIFASAEFPVRVEVTSNDIDIRDVSIKIIPPDEVGFRGETFHTFSTIKKNDSAVVESWIVTPDNEVTREHHMPFGIIVEYTDDVGEQNIDSSTVSVILRPRVFMELTMEGGIWIGSFFIAPYVSLGTIIGIPAGSLLTILLRRRTSRVKRAKRR